ncbi:MULTISPECIES: hypothetical protein [Lactococcus]|nr:MULTISPECIES: hypothetical protein [Lactococcus]MCT0050424.1 hypothetical protein [Lactococcus lactis subsp. lactis]MDT2887864.1 hypothetical protein [Lactococcus lactis]MDT2915783.1 hypothetical protein [Lactococcus lactis]MDT2930582.1 hypothetical protein [Lactococcus lactis]
MKKLNASHICLLIGVVSLLLAFFNSIRALSLPLGILGTVLSIILILKNKNYKKNILIIALTISFISIPIAYGMTYLSHRTDYTSIKTFEKALDDEKHVSGKTIRFKVTNVSVGEISAINASNEVAFYISKTEANDIKKGDIVTVKIKSEATNVLGVYVLSGNVQSK